MPEKKHGVTLINHSSKLDGYHADACEELFPGGRGGGGGGRRAPTWSERRPPSLLRAVRSESWLLTLGMSTLPSVATKMVTCPPRHALQSTAAADMLQLTDQTPSRRLRHHVHQGGRQAGTAARGAPQ